MKLPNAAHAVVHIEKLRNYCLSTTHPRGKHKAFVFASVLDITANEAEILRDHILFAALHTEAVATNNDVYGQRYIFDFEMENKGKKAVIRTSWIILANEDFSRLTSCYVL